MFFEKQGPVWETLRRLEERLRESRIDYVVIGGLALNAYGYRRQTIDVDVVLRAEGLARFREKLVGTEYQVVEGRRRRFYDPQTEVTVDILIAGELAGHRGKNRVVRFPDPGEQVVIEGLATVTLERLITLKLVTWRYRDWGDVVELIRANDLDESFAEKLDPIVRSAYRQCYDEKVEDDRYNPEIHDAPPEVE